MPNPRRPGICSQAEECEYDAPRIEPIDGQWPQTLPITIPCPGCSRKIVVPKEPDATTWLTASYWCHRCGGSASHVA